MARNTSRSRGRRALESKTKLKSKLKPKSKFKFENKNNNKFKSRPKPKPRTRPKTPRPPKPPTPSKRAGKIPGKRPVKVKGRMPDRKQSARTVRTPRARPTIPAIPAAKVATKKPVGKPLQKPQRSAGAVSIKIGRRIPTKKPLGAASRTEGAAGGTAMAAPVSATGGAGEKREEREERGIREKPGKRALGAEMWKRVDRELDEFEKAHRENVSAPVQVRKKDEHIGLKNIKIEIEKNLGAERKADDASLKPHSATISTDIGKQVMIKTGVRGLDDILGGGLPRNSIILLSGTCGTGKSIFGMNFLIEGAMHDEPGIYISLEESPESNIQQMKLFGWPVDELIKRKKLMILQPELYNFDALLTTIEDSIDRINAKRLVIDAISIIGMYFEDPYKVRKSILQLGSLLKKMKCTTIAIDEVREGEPSLSAYGVEEFVVDGVIVLYLIKRSNIYLRAAVVRKMRGVNHSTKIHPMEIKSPGGIVIYPSQELFEEVG